MKYKEIGRKLNISHRTVETHIEQIKNKLNCVNKAELYIKLLSDPLIFNK
jgi:DNA-binding CsgD family transcriptional regulator